MSNGLRNFMLGKEFTRINIKMQNSSLLYGWIQFDNISLQNGHLKIVKRI